MRRVVTYKRPLEGEHRAEHKRCRISVRGAHTFVFAAHDEAKGKLRLHPDAVGKPQPTANTAGAVGCVLEL